MRTAAVRRPCGAAKPSGTIKANALKKCKRAEMQLQTAQYEAKLNT